MDKISFVSAGLKTGVTKEREMSSETNLRDKVEGLECELQSALSLMARVARGEQTVRGMGEWMSLNYPKLREQLPEAMRVVIPKRN